VGTLRYCAPEQLQWNLLEADERADVYGLGAALYEMATLARLFDGDTEPRLIEQVLRHEPRSPRKVDPALPRDLAAIVMNCLDKDRSRRYANARDLAEDLRRFQAHEVIRARPAGMLERSWRWCRREPLASSLVAAILGIVFIIILLFVQEMDLAIGPGVRDSEDRAMSVRILQASWLADQLNPEDRPLQDAQWIRNQLWWVQIQSAATFYVILLRDDQILHFPVHGVKLPPKELSAFPLYRELVTGRRVRKVLPYYDPVFCQDVLGGYSPAPKSGGWGGVVFGGALSWHAIRGLA
jgi:serine/threonine protein kinase